MIELIHPAIRRTADKADIRFSNLIAGIGCSKPKVDDDICDTRLCTDIGTYVRRVNALSDFIDVNEQYKSLNFSRDGYKGDALEILVEFMIKTMGMYNRDIGIINYQPETRHGEDWGVDGIGESVFDGSPVTVQVKFRSNSEKDLTANQDHISNFVAHSLAKYLLPHMEKIMSDIIAGRKSKNKTIGKPIDQRNMLIITTARDLNTAIAEKMYDRKVRVLKYSDLSRMLDGNEAFWLTFKDTLLHYEGNKE